MAPTKGPLDSDFDSMFKDMEKSMRNLDESFRQFDDDLEAALKDVRNGNHIKITLKGLSKPRKTTKRTTLSTTSNLDKRINRMLKDAEERERKEKRLRESKQILADDAQVIVKKVGKGLLKRFGFDKVRDWIQKEIDELKEDLKNGNEENLRNGQRRQSDGGGEEAPSDSVEK